MQKQIFFCFFLIVGYVVARSEITPTQLNKNLFDAVKEGNTHRMVYWIEQGAVVRSTDELHNTILHVAACKNIAILSFVLDLPGVSDDLLNWKNSSGYRPIDVAAYVNNGANMRLLADMMEISNEEWLALRDEYDDCVEYGAFYYSWWG